MLQNFEAFGAGSLKNPEKWRIQKNGESRRMENHEVWRILGLCQNEALNS
ncbi:MAG: hypothetical protein K9K78_08575 [Spirochaetales bacterium]|nr:hypothetical protein [Spirochaetales bacterium]